MQILVFIRSGCSFLAVWCNMTPEKVSKYITIRPGVSSPQGAERRVLLSLPKVKWLEAQPDYQPWPPLREPEPEPPKPSPPPTRYTFRPETRSNELSARQRQAWALHLGGLSMAQIGEKMSCTSNAAGKLVGQAREKLGIGLEK